MKKWILIIILIIIFSILVLAGDGTFKLLFKNSEGTNIASIADNGVSIFKVQCAYGGTCDVASNCNDNDATSCSGSQSTNAFLIKDSGGTIVGYINDTGEICVDGNIDESNPMDGVCAANSLLISDSAGTLEACIDSSGNLFTRGTITCAGSP